MKSWMPLRMVNWFFDQEFSSQGARRLRLNERPIYFFLFDNNRLLWVSFFKLFEESSFRHNSGLILHLFSSSMFRCNHVKRFVFFLKSPVWVWKSSTTLVRLTISPSLSAKSIVIRSIRIEALFWPPQDSELVFCAISFKFVQALNPQGAPWLCLNEKSVHFFLFDNNRLL